MATWCLTPELVEKFKRGLKDREIDPVKLSAMTSVERRSFFESWVGRENAQQVNSLFESKLLLKNQRAGFINWAKKVTGITPKTRMDLLSKIERMDKVLNPKENEQFLQDLASTRLRIDVTEEEAKTISELSSKVSEARDKASEDFIFPTETERLNYGLAKVNLEKYVNDLKLGTRAMNIIKESPGIFKSLVATLDNSFWGRQGIKTLADYKTSKIWLRGFLRSFKDIGRQLFAKGKIWTSGDDAVMDGVKADIYSRPNALSGKYKAGGYQLDVLSEEAFPSSIPEKIPFLGRLFKASEVAYNAAALRLRADLADRYIAIAEKQGLNMLDSAEAQGLGHFIGSKTGRGSISSLTPEGQRKANVLLFSIKFLKSNIDTLTAHQFDAKATPFVKKEARHALLRMVASIASVLSVAKLLDKESVDEDPRSQNFGKVKIFGHWTDLTGGMASLITLVSRLVPTMHNGEWGLWKKSSTGNWTNLTAGQYGQEDAWDLVVNGLFSNKLSPIAGTFRDALRGEMFGGQKFNIKDALANLITPLSVQNFNQFKEDPNTSFLLGSIILEGLGFSVATYNYKADWTKSDSKEMNQFKEKVGKDKFKQANDDYNRAYSNWYSIATQSPEYKRLSDDGKSSLITKAKEEIKQQVFKEYGFKYKQNKKAETEETKSIKALLPE